MRVPAKVAERIRTTLKRFQPVIESAKARDVNESDTSMIVADLLSEMFGYDKYAEITREYQIRGTYCDLATKINNKVQLIVEVKAIGAELKDQHVKQAVDYAANEGIEWAALTNGQYWRVYRVIFGKPIENTLILDIDLLALSHRTAAHIEMLHLLTRDCMVKSGLFAHHDQVEATNKFFLAALALSDPVLTVVRRELRRQSGVKIEVDEIRRRFEQEVIKRELLEGEKAVSAKRRVERAAKKAQRETAKTKKTEPEDPLENTDDA